MKVCTKCGIAKPDDQYHTQMKRGKVYTLRHCIECHRGLMRAHYDANRQKYLDKAAVARTAARAAGCDYIWQFVNAHPCTDCGETDPIVLQFDHCRGKKYKEISWLVRAGCSLDTIKAEIAKCDVVCANCHTRRTASRGKWWMLALIAQGKERLATDQQVGSSSLPEGASSSGGSIPPGSADQ